MAWWIKLNCGQSLPSRHEYDQATLVDNWIAGERVAREIGRIAERPGYPCTSLREETLMPIRRHQLDHYFGNLLIQLWSTRKLCRCIRCDSQ